MDKIFKTFKYIFLGIFLMGIFAAAWSFLIEPSLLFVNEYDLKVKNWNPALNGFRIVAVGDIHGGSNFIDEAKIRKVVRLANEQQPDVIVLLGDYVSESLSNRRKLKMPVETVAENLKGLYAPLGVYAVMGNHDGMYDISKIRKALETNGYRVLENEAVSIGKNGQKLRIIGLPDLLSTNIPDNQIPNARAGLERLGDEEGNVIVLAHNPDDIASVTGAADVSPDFVLFLAAHTHGGQIRLPFIGAIVVPTALGRKYSKGHFYLNGVDVFITSGVGTSILPVRFNDSPEIAVLNISAE